MIHKTMASLDPAPEPVLRATATPRWAVKSGAWVGLSLILLDLIPIPLTGFAHPVPRVSDSTAYITQWFAHYRAKTALQIYLSDVSLALLIWFAVALKEHLGGRRSPGSIFPGMIVPLAAVTAVAISTGNAMWISATLLGTPGHPMSVPVLSSDFDNAINTFYVIAPCMGLLLFAAGAAILQTRALPRWTGWFSFAVAAVNVASLPLSLVHSGWLVPLGWPSIAGYILFYCWIALISVALLRAIAREPDSTPDTPAHVS
jgi:hypothetical protein